MSSKSVTFRLLNHATFHAASGTEITLALAPGEAQEHIIARVESRFGIAIRSPIAIVDDDGVVLIPSYDDFRDGGRVHVVVNRTEQQARQEVRGFLGEAPRSFQLDDPAFPAETGLGSSTPLRPRGLPPASSAGASPQNPQASPSDEDAMPKPSKFHARRRSIRKECAEPSPPSSPEFGIWDDAWGRDEGSASDGKTMEADKEFDRMVAKKKSKRRLG